jgi:hypothetical protein
VARFFNPDLNSSTGQPLSHQAGRDFDSRKNNMAAGGMLRRF